MLDHPTPALRGNSAGEPAAEKAEQASRDGTNPSPHEKTRRSDRISIELPLEVFGDDINRFSFVEKTRTAVVSRHGARIFSQRKLGRDQEVIIRCLTTGKEGEARIVGELGQGPEGYSYGVEFLNPDANLWDIEFPPLCDAERAAGRTLMECMRCHNRELVYLDAVAVEVLDTGQGLSRLCPRCTDIMMWKVACEPPAADATTAGVARPVGSETPSTATESRNPGTSVLLRHPILGDETVSAENISPAGLSIRSIKRYRLGAPVEVAIPYTKGGANIFVAARIEQLQETPGEKFLTYTLAYVPREEWARK